MKKLFLLLIVMLMSTCNDDETFNPTLSSDTSNQKSFYAKEGDETTKLMVQFEEKLGTDQSFIDFARSYFDSELVISEIEIRKKLDSNYKVEMIDQSTDVESDAVYNTLTYFTLFYSQNQDFDKLTKDEKVEVINKVLSKAKANVDKQLESNPKITFASNSLESVLVDFNNGLINLGSTLPPTVTNPTTGQIITTNGLTWGEVGSCAIAAAADYVGSNWSLIKGLYGILKGESLTFGVVKAAVRLFFPEAAMAGTVVGLAGCLLTAYFF